MQRFAIDARVFRVLSILGNNGHAYKFTPEMVREWLSRRGHSYTLEQIERTFVTMKAKAWIQQAGQAYYEATGPGRGLCNFYKTLDIGSSLNDKTKYVISRYIHDKVPHRTIEDYTSRTGWETRELREVLVVLDPLVAPRYSDPTPLGMKYIRLYQELGGTFTIPVDRRLLMQTALARGFHQDANAKAAALEATRVLWARHGVAKYARETLPNGELYDAVYLLDVEPVRQALQEDQGTTDVLEDKMAKAANSFAALTNPHAEHTAFANPPSIFNSFQLSGWLKTIEAPVAAPVPEDTEHVKMTFVRMRILASIARMYRASGEAVPTGALSFELRMSADESTEHVLALEALGFVSLKAGKVLPTDRGDKVYGFLFTGETPMDPKRLHRGSFKYIIERLISNGQGTSLENLAACSGISVSSVRDQVKALGLYGTIPLHEIDVSANPIPTEGPAEFVVTMVPPVLEPIEPIEPKPMLEFSCGWPMSKEDEATMREVTRLAGISINDFAKLAVMGKLEKMRVALAVAKERARYLIQAAVNPEENED